MSAKRKTRITQEIWLLGSFQPDIVGEFKNEETGEINLVTSFYKKQLPSKKQVLQHLFYLKSEEMKGKPLKDITDRVLEEIIMIWDQAKIPTLAIKNSVKKLENLFHEWRELQKNKSRNTPSAIQKRDEFIEKLPQLFDISAENWEKMILSDKSRSEEAKAEDICFLPDQRK